MRTMNRRQFLALSGAASLLAAFPRSLFPVAPLPQAAPAPLGRVATWWRQTVHTEPSQNAPFVASKGRDEIIPLYAAVVGEAPWPTNPIWYQTSGGYIHSGYVQPVEDAPQSEIIAPVEEPGFWAEVCVPVAEATWQPGSPYVAYRLYHGTVYRVIRAVGDGGDWFYQLQDGLTWSPGPFVPTRSLRRIPAEQLTPISPGRPDKTIRINIADQRLTCLEGRHPVFTTRIASGVHGLGTPLGKFKILLQRHTNRMVGGGSDDPYDLPGVPFPVYFTWSGVAIHGTYWHNDYGRRHSHGCVNVTNEAARWVFRWAQPHVPYGEHTLRSPRGQGTRVVVV